MQDTVKSEIKNPLTDIELWKEALKRIDSRDVLVFLLCLIASSMVTLMFIKSVSTSEAILMAIIIISLSIIVGVTRYFRHKESMKDKIKKDHGGYFSVSEKEKKDYERREHQEKKPFGKARDILGLDD